MEKDRILEVSDVIKLFRYDNKGSASNRISILRRQLGKPRNGIITVSEFCAAKGITLQQFEQLTN